MPSNLCLPCRNQRHGYAAGGGAGFRDLGNYTAVQGHLIGRYNSNFSTFWRNSTSHGRVHGLRDHAVLVWSDETISMDDI